PILLRAEPQLQSDIGPRLAVRIEEPARGRRARLHPYRHRTAVFLWRLEHADQPPLQVLKVHITRPARIERPHRELGCLDSLALLPAHPGPVAPHPEQGL